MRKTILLALIWLAAGVAPAVAKRPLTFEELMKFRQIHDASLSHDGEWIAYAAIPDRGDGEGIVRHASRNTEYRVGRGATPKISADGKWVAFKLEVPFEHQKRKGENDAVDEDDVPKPGLALLRTQDGHVEEFERVQSFYFSEDGRWLAFHFHPQEDEDAQPENEDEEEEEGEEEEKPREATGTLRVRDLSTREDQDIAFVKDYALDETSTYLAYAVATETGNENGLFVQRLGADVHMLHAAATSAYPQMRWAKQAPRLAYLSGAEAEEGTVTDVELHLWEPAGGRVLATAADAPEGWEIPAENALIFSDDTQRLFFGFKPAAQDEDEKETDDEAVFDPYDRNTLLDQVSLDVWHSDDPLIKTHVRTEWKKESKRTYRAVVHLETDAVVPLADEQMRDVEVSQNPRVALASADVPYLQEITWDGSYRDLYLVDLRSGDRRRVATRLQFASSLAPGGKYAVFYQDEDWHLVETASGRIQNVTAELDVLFADEDHDYPSERPGYGLGGWAQDDAAVLIYDKYDIWQFPTGGGPPLCLTGGRGRDEQTQFRVIDLDLENPYVQDELLLLAYRDQQKNHAFFQGQVGTSTLTLLREQPKLFEFKAKAKHADRILYTEQTYAEFPDLWVSDPDFERPRKRTQVNPQIQEFAWGEAELVQWTSADGIALQGVLIKPGNYEKGKRYPVLVYFYRFFSQRLHEFNEPVINHRPSFPMYASNGYCVFLPDIRFEVGTPGLSAVKCLVPGVQKLVDMGVADPEAIALHGHSWSGYQAAYVVTQTDIFAACVAGAPVSNMTSAYGGIRLESGLARQFQYEKSQSRIGHSLWERRDLYIENSPLFFADRIGTPLVIQFGDVDEAVPWHQGVELYLAMRRLDKPCVFLQYRGEPHHLKKYPNKLDYSIKMMEFFDHFCKGAPAPSWWTEGVAYEGED